MSDPVRLKWFRVSRKFLDSNFELAFCQFAQTLFPYLEEIVNNNQDPREAEIIRFSNATICAGATIKEESSAGTYSC